MPSYYFEVTVLERGTDGEIFVGFFASDKPFSGGAEPGLSLVPMRSCGLVLRLLLLDAR